MKPLQAVFIVGPTASGKTSLAIELAKRMNGEIVNADSMQVYKELIVGAAKPTMQERQGIMHHVMDVVHVGEEYSAAMYQAQAMQSMLRIVCRDKLPVVCGGTGLYVDALTHKMDFTQVSGAPELRRELQEYLHIYGPQALHKRLERVDKTSANRLHPNDTKRIIRALEVYSLTGLPLSEQGEGFRRRPIADYPICMIGLRWPRAQINARIETRVEQMMAQGLYQEAHTVYSLGIPPDHPSMMGLGYRQLYRYFTLEHETSLEEAVERIKIETKRFAKRQMTWFSRDLRIHWLDADRFADVYELADAAQMHIISSLRLGGPYEHE